jgi:hypothetical protein
MDEPQTKLRPVGPQLFCEGIVSQGRRNTGMTYTLFALLHDGRKAALLKSLPALDQGRFIEQRVEACLGIENTRVGGEYVQ